MTLCSLYDSFKDLEKSQIYLNETVDHGSSTHVILYALSVNTIMYVVFLQYNFMGQDYYVDMLFDKFES